MQPNLSLRLAKGCWQRSRCDRSAERSRGGPRQLACMFCYSVPGLALRWPGRAAAHVAKDKVKTRLSRNHVVEIRMERGL